MHEVVVTAVRAAVSAATIILASMSKILFLSISKIENWKLKIENWKLILLPLESARAVPGIVQVSALRVCKWKWDCGLKFTMQRYDISIAVYDKKINFFQKIFHSVSRYSVTVKKHISRRVKMKLYIIY